MTYRVIVFREGSAWSAVCLDHFVAASGRDPWEAMSALGDVLAAQDATDTPVATIAPAPSRYW